MNPHAEKPEKGELLRKSEQHRQLLEADVKSITEQSEKLVTNALIIGGALAVTYLLLRTLSGHARNDKPKAAKARQVEVAEREHPTFVAAAPYEPGILSQVGSMLAAQAAGFLLSIAREKLVEYLQSQGHKRQES